MLLKLFAMFSVIVESCVVASHFTVYTFDRHQTVYPGENVTFNCTVAYGDAADNIHWTKDGQTVIDKHILNDSKSKKHRWSAVLLSNVQVQDRGRYICKATKGNHQDSDNIDLHVYEAPKIPKFERIKIVKDATSPKIRCQASGWPVPQLSWWRNDVTRIYDADLKLGQSYLLERPTESQLSLKIVYAEPFHQATYTCVAENKIGKYNSSFQLLIKRDDLISEQTKPAISIEGRDITLQCECTKSECRDNSTATYWRNKWSQPITPSTKYLTSQRLSSNGLTLYVTITNASVADQGTYWCGVNTSAGIDLKTRHLHILAKDAAPEANALEETISVKPQATAKLQCNVTYPDIELQPATSWVVNGSVIRSDSQHYMIAKSGPFQERERKRHLIKFQLRIFNTSSYDAGQYTCRFEFTTGIVDANITLTLQESQTDANPGKSHSQKSSLVAIGSMTAGGTILGLVISLIAYRLCHNKKNPENLFSASPANNRKFTYDVFVTFSSSDLGWVKMKLIPLIEKHQLKYCIHYRDFKIGGALVDNMANSVYTSRKVVAVMSRDYLSSKYCRGELEMALYRSTELGDSSVIVVRIDGTDRNKLPKALRNRTFLDYHDSTERKTWEERLIKHLKPPINKSPQKDLAKSTSPLVV